jgi:ferredoxin
VKVIVDNDRCELHGECTVAAPDVFAIEDDKDWVTVLDAEPGEHLRSAVEEAALMCPVAAIRIED